MYLNVCFQIKLFATNKYDSYHQNQAVYSRLGSYNNILFIVNFTDHFSFALIIQLLFIMMTSGC